MTGGAADRAEQTAPRSVRTVAEETPPTDDEVPAADEAPSTDEACPTDAASSTDEASPTDAAAVEADDTQPAPEVTPRGSDDNPRAPDFRTALVSGISVDLPNQHPTVVLRESESPRRQLSFSVSLQDGVVLSHVIRRIPTPRPLTHELFSEVLAGFDIDIVALRLVGRRGAIYFAELDLRGRSGRSVHSCRPSDGLAVALIQPVPVPILIDARLFEESGDVVPGAAPRPS